VLHHPGPPHQPAPDERRGRALLELRPAREFIEQRQFWAAQDHLLEKPGTPDDYASKSLVPDRWLSPGTVESVVEWVRDRQPGAPGHAGYVTLFAMGGASGRPEPGETAYPHRDATFVIDIGTHCKADTPQAGVRRQLARTRALHRTLSRDLEARAAYVNFPDPDLTTGSRRTTATTTPACSTSSAGTTPAGCSTTPRRSVHDAYEAPPAGGVGVVLVGRTAVQDAPVVDHEAVAVLEQGSDPELRAGQQPTEGVEGGAPLG
ncbi:hypothetical protein VR46_20380, partial [Streptomyces sp. NRRL S-444]